PGALVWLNDVEVGTTPLETDFTYYGGYDVRIRRPGFEPVLDRRKIEPPLYERPVIDLFAEMWPGRLHNRVEWAYALTPAVERDPDRRAAERTVIARASELRAQLEGPDWIPPNPDMPVGRPATAPAGQPESAIGQE
ncbi:MAG: PEGA domain-containing protein, partial [Phycisphaerales bacterium]